MKLFLCGLMIIMAFAASAKIEKGKPFPSVSLNELNGKKSGDISKLAKKKPLTIVDFWASWCKPCEKSMPALNELYASYKDKGLLIVGVNVNEEKKDGIDFAKKLNIKFPVLYDGTRKLVEKVGVSAMPSSYLVDQTGKVILVHHGFREGDKEKLEAEIKKVLK